MTKARDLANASTALSAVSATELAFVDGVTSAIQTQLDAKAPSSTAVTLTGTQTLTNKTLTSPALTTPTISTATTNGDILYGTGSGALARLGIGSSAQVLTVASGIPTWATPAGGGKVLQVVFASTSTEKAVSSATYVDSNLTATITPTLNTSKILVLVSQNGCRGTSAQYGGFKLMRGATQLALMDTYLSYIPANTAQVSISANYLDSPATTSATTYKTTVSSIDGSASYKVQIDGLATSFITLLEIGA